MNGWNKITTSTRWSGCLLVGLMLLWATAATANQDEDPTKHPGYVSFEGLGHFDPDEALVEIDLTEQLLRMAGTIMAGSDPELGEVMSKLKLVRVQKFELDRKEAEDVEAKVMDMASKLEADGWMRVVRVREDVDHVHVYFKLEGDTLQGITVMAIENWETAAFVNIVGEIDPEQIGRLGAKFNIEELHDMDWDWDNHRRDRSRRDRDQDRDRSKDGR